MKSVSWSLPPLWRLGNAFGTVCFSFVCLCACVCVLVCVSVCVCVCVCLLATRKGKMEGAAETKQTTLKIRVNIVKKKREKKTESIKEENNVEEKKKTTFFLFGFLFETGDRRFMRYVSVDVSTKKKKEKKEKQSTVAHSVNRIAAVKTKDARSITDREADAKLNEGFSDPFFFFGCCCCCCCCCCSRQQRPPARCGLVGLFLFSGFFFGHRPTKTDRSLTAIESANVSTHRSYRWC